MNVKQLVARRELPSTKQATTRVRFSLETSFMVMKLLANLEKLVLSIRIQALRKLNCKRVQCDEIW
jgi:hypothetical protein